MEIGKYQVAKPCTSKHSMPSKIAFDTCLLKTCLCNPGMLWRALSPGCGTKLWQLCCAALSLEVLLSLLAKATTHCPGVKAPTGTVGIRDQSPCPLSHPLLLWAIAADTMWITQSWNPCIIESNNRIVWVVLHLLETCHGQDPTSCGFWARFRGFLQSGLRCLWCIFFCPRCQLR